jgi:ribonuclease E
MAKRMLIDTSHPEETRVAVVAGHRIEEFDFESQSKKQLKGNIYLAKIVRVEPSLQAAFVDYGGNRHGFLAFSEIHPDYYRIPVADREALLAAEAEQIRRDDEAEEAAIARGETPPPRRDDGRGDNGHHDHEVPNGESAHAADDQGADDHAPDDHGRDERDSAADAGQAADPDVLPFVAARQQPEAAGSVGDSPMPADEPHAAPANDTAAAPLEAGHDAPQEIAQSDEGASDAPEGRQGRVETIVAEAVPIEVMGGDDVDEAVRRRPRPFRSYKIQEVIKRRQIMLVQVVKEERGNKGAALTTYLSLAGRYCVLMPNSPRGGGISRKITHATDRKRLKSLIDDLEVPEGMAVIVRTAGSERSRAELRRDYEYLMRLWDHIREETLRSTAPKAIHEEASLIKRAIRDLYARDIDEVIVEGAEGYRVAKEFMRTLMPSHAKRVTFYQDSVPLLQRFQVESQIDAIHQPMVQLRSGGSIVINQTEALVAIDVNSGRATRERHIEETALKTNLEAADEIARQLRLRDLAGLIVIDFIDMEESRNNHAVERRLKEALKQDRARIQIGRISPFGLLEMSHQRLRPSLFEASTEICPHCGGSGRVRSTESSALHVLRAIEEEALRGRSAEFLVHVPTSVALYMLNQKRAALADIELRYAVKVGFAPDDTLIPPNLRIEQVRARLPGEMPPPRALPGRAVIDPEAEAAADAAAEAAAAAELDEFTDASDEDAADERPARRGDDEDRHGGRGRRRRGRRSRGHDERSEAGHERAPRVPAEPAGQVADDGSGLGGQSVPVSFVEGAAGVDGAGEGVAGEGEDEFGNRRRRRGRRGGRRRHRGGRGEFGQGEFEPGEFAQDGAAAGEGAGVSSGQDDAGAPVEPDAPLPSSPALTLDFTPEIVGPPSGVERRQRERRAPASGEDEVMPTRRGRGRGDRRRRPAVGEESATPVAEAPASAVPEALPGMEPAAAEAVATSIDAAELVRPGEPAAPKPDVPAAAAAAVSETAAVHLPEPPAAPVTGSQGSAEPIPVPSPPAPAAEPAPLPGVVVRRIGADDQTPPADTVMPEPEPGKRRQGWWSRLVKSS